MKDRKLYIVGNGFEAHRFDPEMCSGCLFALQVLGGKNFERDTIRTHLGYPLDLLRTFGFFKNLDRLRRASRRPRSWLGTPKKGRLSRCVRHV
jgi:hypothetical protein